MNIKKRFFKRIAIITTILFSINSLNALITLSNNRTTTATALAAELSDEVLSDNFDLEKAVENMPSINDMNHQEKIIFENIIEEQVEMANLETQEEKELFYESIKDFFDETSSTYNDLSAATTKIENDIKDLKKDEISEENYYSAIDIIKNNLGIKEAYAAIQIKIGVKLAGAIFNTMIGFAVGGGVGAIQAFIVKKGKAEAKKIFTKTVVSKLKEWGAPKLAAAVGGIIGTAMNYLDIGTKIAQILDSKDKRPNNGYIDFY